MTAVRARAGTRTRSSTGLFAGGAHAAVGRVASERLRVVAVVRRRQDGEEQIHWRRDGALSAGQQRRRSRSRQSQRADYAQRALVQIVLAMLSFVGLAVWLGGRGTTGFGL